MQYITNGIEHSLRLSKEELEELLGSKEKISDTSEFRVVKLLKYILHSTKEDIYQWEEGDLKQDLLSFFEDHDISTINKAFINHKLRKFYSDIREKIAPLIYSDNLSILMSNGCSMVAGSKGINCGINNELSEILEKFKHRSNKLSNNIKSFKNLSPEKVLDKLYQIKSYFEIILQNDKDTYKINNLINEYREVLLKSYVLGIDYSKIDIHKNLLMKLMGIKNKRTTLFTLNYDLLIEKASEELNIQLNNGFRGFHFRKFNPSNFNYQNYIETSSHEKLSTKSFNLVKLHGSLSWQYSEDEPVYSIVEKQLCFNNDNKISFESISNEAIIYPVQTKKSQSLDLPYSEMFRQLNETLNKRNTTLIVVGYSFLDEHVNDIINNALSNPYFNLVIFSYTSLDEIKEDDKSELYKYYNQAKNDNRISIFSGNILGDFATVTNDLIPTEPPKNILRELETIIKKNRT